ncbi:LuxR C-terminal-related transcriptional regulator [Tsukamurella sp. NPDC003166]|uniref:LuxR C-terminal-related transcriptional regulator n=1 Tax=Tsukamurella sp. NPDC003166 TaxID=3154444 RepID=UPI0033B03C1E
MVRRALVRRQRLLDVLAAGGDSALTVIHGPAGYGKSTLAAQWQELLRGEGVAVGWLSIDRDDNNPVWFLRDLIAAITRADATLGSGLIAIAEQNAQDGVRAVVAGLIDQIREYGAPVAVVIDDWHLVDDESVLDVFAYLLGYCPENLRLIVTSRMRVHAVAELRVRNRLNEIDARQLRFDEEESAVFLREMNALRLGDEDVHRLWATTDGWVAALQLATLSLRESADPAAAIAAFGGRHHSIGEYLAEAVLDALSSDLLDFLLATSICDRLCADLAAVVSGVADGHAALDELQRRNLFLIPLDDEGTWFRYHHLFAGYLRRRLERDAPTRIPGLHRAASVWLGKAGHLSEAVDHALLAGEPERAADLVEAAAMMLVEESRMATMLGTVDKLPARIVATRPRLQIAIAWAYCLLHRLDEADLALARVRTAMSADLPDALRSEADMLAACIEVYSDRIDRVPALLAPIVGDPRSFRPFMVSGTANLVSFVELHSFRYDEALATQRSASAYHELNPGSFAPVYGQCFAGLAEAARLDLDAAERHYRAAIGVAVSRGDAGTYAERLASGQLGVLLYERDMVDDAERLLEKCLLLGIEGGVADLMISSYTTMARIRRLRGDEDGARALLIDARRAGAKLRLPRLAAAADQELTALLIASGDIAGARDLVARNGAGADVLGPRVHTGISLSIHRSRLAMQTKLALAQGDLGGAATAARERVDAAVAAKWPYEEVAARVALAEVLSSGDRDEALHELLPALVAGSRAGLVRTVVDGGPAVVRVLADLSDQLRVGRRTTEVSEIPSDYLRTLLTAASPPSDRALRSGVASGERGALPEEALNGREVEIVRLLERGMPNSGIARTFGIKLNTVKWYLKNIYTKLGVVSRGEAVAEARRRGLVD